MRSYMKLVLMLVGWMSKVSECRTKAVIVSGSRFWFNYRHTANALGFADSLVKLGFKKADIVLMLADDHACDPRNIFPGSVFLDTKKAVDLYEGVVPSVVGSAASAGNFRALLAGQSSGFAPRNQRLQNAEKFIVFFSGHSGPGFMKFGDATELPALDVASSLKTVSAFTEKILWIADTCKSATLHGTFKMRNFMSLGSSGEEENSYSHVADKALGVYLADRFSYYLKQFLDSPGNKYTTVHNLVKALTPEKLRSNVSVDLKDPDFSETLNPKNPETPIVEFVLLRNFDPQTENNKFHADLSREQSKKLGVIGDNQMPEQRIILDDRKFYGLLVVFLLALLVF